MMGRALLIVGGLAVAGFVVAGVLGYQDHSSVESLRLHLLTGFGAVLLLLLAQIWMLIFLWGTGRVIRRTALGSGLEPRFVAGSREGWRRAAPWLVMSLGLAVATFAVGPEVIAGGVPTWLHAVLAGAALLAQVGSLLVARGALHRNAADLREIERLVAPVAVVETAGE